MIFSSLVFLCVFLPVTYILYWIMPSLKAKNGLLIIASLLFYAYGEPVYVLLMVLCAFINYGAALLISHMRRGKKAVLLLGVLADLSMLGFYKYAEFFVDTVNRIFQKNISCLEILLPVGISFFTFQAVSYIIDVYAGKVDAQKSFPKVLLYICFFPQLIAGPIVKYRDISVSLENRKCSSRQAAAGLRRFICGLAKKVLIANAMGTVADSVFGAEYSHINAVTAWIGAAAYLMQIYYDFSGYSDMAIGLSNMFGFRFRENFQYPYGAVSIQDFWRRWHISLSEWFKEYVYIPLGGNRNGKFLTVINRMVVFFLTGLWHGADWTFILWGIYHGFLLLLEECLPVVRKLPEWIGRIYTVLLVCVGFVMFRADTVSQGMYYIRQMFTGFWTTTETVSFAWQQLTPYFIVMFIAAVVGSAPIHRLSDFIREKINNNSKADISVMRSLLNTGSVILLVWCMFRLSGSTYNPFIYFRF